LCLGKRAAWLPVGNNLKKKASQGCSRGWEISFSSGTYCNNSADKCGGEAELLTKGLANFEDQLMGQTQKPIFFPHGTKGQLWFNGTTATIQDALLGHLSNQAPCQLPSEVLMWQLKVRDCSQLVFSHCLR